MKKTSFIVIIFLMSSFFAFAKPQQGLPSTNPDYFRVAKNTTLTVTHSEGLFYGQTPDVLFESGNRAVLTKDVVIAHGVLVVNEDGSLTYTPEPDFIGNDSFSYKVCNSSQENPQCTNNYATSVITVVEPNRDAPVITLAGDSFVNVVEGDLFVDPGATADDSEDGDLTSSITHSTDLNTNIPGRYYVVYSVGDSGIPKYFGYATRTISVTALNIQDQSLTFDELMNVNVSVGNIILNATSTSGLLPQYEAEGSCSIDNIVYNKLIVTGPGNCSVTAMQMGNELYGAATSVQRSFIVEDSDGVPNDVEDSGPNNGDSNGDNVKDSAQQNVVSIINPSISNNSYVTLEVEGTPGVPVITNFEIFTKVNTSTIGSSTLPVGGFEFKFTGNPLQTFRVKLILDQVYETGRWTLMKFKNDTFFPGPEATFRTVQIGQGQGTEISYSLTDQGQFDDDSREGYITDPVFAVQSQAVQSSQNTSSSVSQGSIVVPDISYSTNKTGTSSQGQVLGQSVTCGVYMNLGEGYLKRGKYNDPEKVITLKKFLNKELGLNLSLNAYFGPQTEDAVKRFQLKYKDKVLKPWGIEKPTGIVYLTTSQVINYLNCPELGYTLPTGALVPIR